MNEQDLELLAGELREKIIDTTAMNGGHLAASLGTVELTISLLRAFSPPKEPIVWDVGHQAYAYKLLTGRFEQFDTLRKKDGISGFPNRQESSYDVLTAGHASTSISAAVGLARAKELKGDRSCVVAVIGDGALTGGLSYEGLNNAGRLSRNLIVILNDNKMSISGNVGAMPRYLARIRTAPRYQRAKGKVERVLKKIPLIGNGLYRFLYGLKAHVRHLFYGSNLFENLGFSYYGPLNGHNISDLTDVFENVKKIDRPVLIHVVTEKGHGYGPARDNPDVFHGVSGFDVKTGKIKSAAPSFSSVFGEELCKLAMEDKSVCAVTAAMSEGTGLSDFSHQFPDRFFDVGIAEEHAVTFCGGLAAGGMNPVFAVYSTFLQRSYDQMIHDAALQKVKLTLAVDRAGIVGADGVTHQGLFDAAYLNTIPGIEVWSPTYFSELRAYLRHCLNAKDGVFAIRYPRGGEPQTISGYPPCPEYPFSLYGNGDTLLVTYGRLFTQAVQAAEILRNNGVRTAVLKLNRITPIDPEAINLSSRFHAVFFFEEGVKSGGIGESFGERLLESGFCGKWHLYAVDNGFVPHMTTDEALESLSLTAPQIAHSIRNALEGEM